MCKVAGPMLTSSSSPPSPKSKESNSKPTKDELVTDEKMFQDANRDTFWQIKLVTYQKIEI